VSKDKSTDSRSTRRRLGNHEFGHRAAFAAFSIFAAGALAGCRSHGPVVATLLDRQGHVERASGSDWTDAYVGFAFEAGGALRTGTASEARLRLQDGSLIHAGEDARLRFGTELLVEHGAAEVESGGGGLRLATAAGSSRLEPGAHARVRFDERAGGAVVEPVVEPFEPPAAVAAVAVAPPPVAPPERPAAVEAAKPPARDDAARPEPTAAAGESAVVYANHAGPRVRLRANGRTYTVLVQQSHLPPLLLVWPHVAHAAKPVALHFASPGGEWVLHVRGVRTRLRPGTLGEGTHTWWYEAGDGKRSPKSTVVLRSGDTPPLRAQRTEATPAPRSGLRDHPRRRPNLGRRR
jgi:hypothetical protein